MHRLNSEVSRFKSSVVRKLTLMDIAISRIEIRVSLRRLKFLLSFIITRYFTASTEDYFDIKLFLFIYYSLKHIN